MAVLVAMPVAVTANAVTPANPYAGQQTRSDRVLEVGFGPGVIIHRLSKLAAAGHVAGIDQSREMVEQARARNATGIQSGRVDLRHGSVESLPFDYNSFDRAACDQLDASLAERGGWIAGNTASHEIWRPDRAWLYALFRAAEQRIDGNTHRRWLREGARGGEIHEEID